MSNMSVRYNVQIIAILEVTPGIKFQALILMSSQLIDSSSSDLHGPLKIYLE